MNEFGSEQKFYLPPVMDCSKRWQHHVKKVRLLRKLMAENWKTYLEWCGLDGQSFNDIVSYHKNLSTEKIPHDDLPLVDKLLLRSFGGFDGDSERLDLEFEESRQEHLRKMHG
jgi:hypothetical protein